ncbi:MAG: PAS domain-containing protein [Nitrospirae bacterium]|nr:MAG: PAS domain-containing protein [Nitrospirota bacterium]
MFRTKIVYRFFLAFLVFSIFLLVPLMLSLNKELKDMFVQEEAMEGKFLPPEYSEPFDTIHQESRKKITRQFISISFYSFFAAFMLSLFLTRKLHQSLHSLSEGATKIRDGNLDIDLPVLSDDELGEVTRAFNEMAQSLKIKTEELKQKDLYIQNMMDALWVVNEADIITDINPAFTKLFGYERKDVIGTSIYNYFDEESERIVRKELEERRKRGISSTYQIRIISSNGTPVPVLITGAPIIKDGEIIGKIGIMKDFREQHRLLSELIESKEHLETIMNNIQDSILIIDRDYRIVRANRASMRQYGPDIVGKRCFEVSHHLSRPCWHEGEECPLQHVFSEGEVFRHIHEHFSSTGEKRFEEIVASPITDSSGNTVEIIELLRDITDRKIFEEEISRRNRELTLLNSISSIVHRSLKADEVLSGTIDKLIDTLQMDGGGFFILDEKARVLNCTYHRGISEEFVKEVGRVKLGDDIPGRVALTGELITTSDISRDRRITRSLLKHSGIKGYCCIPVKGKERILGVFCLFSYRNFNFSEDDIRLLRSVGEMTGLALENIRLYEQMKDLFQLHKERRVTEQESLLSLSERLSTALDVSEVIEATSNLIKTVLRADILIFWSFSYDEKLELACSLGIEPPFRSIQFDTLTPETHVVDSHTSLNIRSLLDEDRLSGISYLKDEGVNSLLVYPVFIGDRLIGVFTMGRKTPSEFKEDDIHLLRIITSMFAVSLERSNLYESRIVEKGLAEAVLNTITEGVCVVDTDGRITSGNRSLERLLEQPLMNLLGLDLRDIVSQQGGDPSIIDSALNGEEARGEISLVEGDQMKTLEINALPLITPQGEIYGAVQVLRDITREREIDRIKTDLIRSVSHEFRTPLSAIVGLSEMLIDRVVSGDRAESYLETIHNEGVRLSNMVSDLLDISRIESGKVHLKREDLDLVSILSSIEKLLSKEFQKKGISFSYHVDDAARFINADEERIKQVLMNLIDNALKYSDPSATIEVSGRLENSYVIIEVRDTGWGIPPEDLPHIGERFYRGRHGRVSKGTGLGLSLCKEIIGMHGGNLEIKSTQGEGTTISITIPLGRVENG